MSTPEPAGLHTENPTGRFRDRAADYRRFRPSYPKAAIDMILDGLTDPHFLSAADIGAGTGISARLLAERGVRVAAIEPNAAMRAEALPHPLVTWTDATAEHTRLGAGAVDLVMCAQAFHWFEPMAALAEFHRVLRPGGRVALIWNDRDSADPLTARYGELIRTASGLHPAEDHTRPGPLMVSPLFRDQRELTVSNHQDLDAQGLVGRAMSASYVPKDGPPLDVLMHGLRTLHSRFADAAGLVRLRYVTRVFLAERAI